MKEGKENGIFNNTGYCYIFLRSFPSQGLIITKIHTSTKMSVPYKIDRENT